MSEGSAFTDDDDDDHNHKNFGSFTSTVCVNFSQDDLRLATIPGQEGVGCASHIFRSLRSATFWRLNQLWANLLGETLYRSCSWQKEKSN